MPYVCKKHGDKWVLTKKDGSRVMGTHPARGACINQMRAVYANETKDPKNIFVEGVINGVPIDFDRRIQDAGEYVNVIINSQGGDYFSAIMMHNKLRSSGKKVVSYIQSSAFSAAAVLALAGDTIYMAENALLMFHPTKISSFEQKDSEELKKLAEILDKSTQTLVTTIVSKTGMEEEKARKLVESETWLTADEAQALGIVDEIIPIMRDVQITSDFPERIVNFLKEKENMPLKEICEKFGVADEVALVAFIEKLQEKPKEPSPVPTNIVNMVKKSREIELNNLVSQGVAVPAVVNELKLKFMTDDRIVADIRNESSDFDSVVNALAKNEKVINLGSRSGVQQLPKSENDQADILVKNMEKRGKK